MTRARYQESNFSGKLMAAFLLVMIIAVVVAFAKYLGSVNNKEINGQTADVEIVDDNTFRLTFDVVRKNTDKDYLCIVKALDYEVAEVGRREVLIPAGGEKNQRFTTDIHTRAQAVSGDVYGCTEHIPFYIAQ